MVGSAAVGQNPSGVGSTGSHGAARERSATSAALLESRWRQQADHHGAVVQAATGARRAGIVLRAGRGDGVAPVFWYGCGT